MAGVEQARQAQISPVAALDEPSRRRLYDYVVRQPQPVNRDAAAAALELLRSTMARNSLATAPAPARDTQPSSTGGQIAPRWKYLRRMASNRAGRVPRSRSSTAPSTCWHRNTPNLCAE